MNISLDKDESRFCIHFDSYGMQFQLSYYYEDWIDAINRARDTISTICTFIADMERWKDSIFYLGYIIPSGYYNSDISLCLCEDDSIWAQLSFISVDIFTYLTLNQLEDFKIYLMDFIAAQD